MKHFYFDLGVGDGSNIKDFLNENLILFNDPITEWMVIGYEPTPWNDHVLQDLQASFPGVSIEIREEAAWIENGTIEFGINEKMDGNTLVEDCDVFNTGTKIIVPCVDFSEILATMVSIEDEVVVRMNIEGAEYGIIRKLIDTGTIKLIDKLYADFHHLSVHCCMPPSAQLTYSILAGTLINDCPIPIRDYRIKETK